MRKPTIYFADTTIVYYRLHGHQLLQREVTDLVKDGVLCTSNFVKGEYIRGYITGLIELFCVIQEEDSVQEGIQLFLADTGRNPRKVANAVASTADWLRGQEESAAVEVTSAPAWRIHPGLSDPVRPVLSEALPRLS